jgi:hypothetical protein
MAEKKQVGRIVRDASSGQFKSLLKPEDEAYILNNYMTMSDKELGEQIGVDHQVVNRFRVKNSLYKQPVSYEDTFGDSTTTVETKEDKITSDSGKKEKVAQQETQTAAEGQTISYEQEKKNLQKYLRKDIEKLLPRQCVSDIAKRDEFLDKFIILRRSFNNQEWQDFLSHWMRYMMEHKLDFNIAEDFDDLAGLVREIIIQANIFEKNKTTRTSDAFYQVYMKQFNESVTRQKKYQDNLDLSRRKRKENNDYDKESFSEIVAMFDNEETRKLMIEADKQDNIELLSYMDKIRRKMKDEGAGKEEVDGQESALLMNMNEDKLNDITERGIKILESEASDNK